MANLSLLSSNNRVETPYIKVTIADYTFGVYSKNNQNYSNDTNIKYPNYIQSLSIKKINGKVNTYTLKIVYPITKDDDPNFFEKVFSKAKKTRKIVFSYGDMSLPSFIYKNEEALILKVIPEFNMSSSVIYYTVTAVSSAIKGTSGVYTFGEQNRKPSDVIKELIQIKSYGLADIFTGMRDYDLVIAKNLIDSDDAKVHLEMQTNISVLDYLSYLVSCMKPDYKVARNLQQGSFYSLVIVDKATEMYTDDNGDNFIFDGPYFEVKRNVKRDDYMDAYTLDIGYPSNNIVLQFSINQDDTYALLYDYQNELNSGSYVQRINDEGEFEQEYAPVISSRNDEYKTRANDEMWWSKVTEYPIKATISVKGLLRPALLMRYIRLNVFFWGHKHISSGLYIITEQQDEVGMQGFRTTLQLLRVDGAEFDDSVM